ncbi:interleukin-6 receptor subunit beta-like [Astyanax mexicanus]|uniref:interleukin-6 receptor subunit beta-like n=1 Tax=Astyanax mexicanus TaxID=7994 RepID=UPI0020CB5DE3|nr:interleukin-6 receptor subunit beta-like [Astyanax mexicanus]
MKTAMDFVRMIVFYLLNRPLTASELLPESRFSPTNLECVFFVYANVTCYWTPGVDAHPDTNYTLNVSLPGFSLSQCNSSQPNCSVPIHSLHRNYCIQVFAHSKQHPTTVSSEMLCLSGIDAVKLPEPVGFTVTPEKDRPQCLRLSWSPPQNFPLSDKTINEGFLLYELQYSTPEQSETLSVKVDLREEVQCVFSPCTQYSVKMRYCNKHTLVHWSAWSPTATNRTEAEAPAFIPQLWRTVQSAGVAGLRLVTLLWKARLQQQAACTAVWFSVQCRVVDSQADVSSGDCTDLSLTNKSCQLTIPPEPCTCTLTMSNSAGSAPPATITIPSQWESGQTSLVTVQVTPLDDLTLKVQWKALESPNITGFIVEWCRTADSSRCQTEPYWQRVDQNTFKTIITEGLKENISYSVSVRAVHAMVSGPGIRVLTYTGQTAPSAGPQLYVAEHGCSYVVLRWSAVPLELRNGFITKYTLLYQTEDNSIRELLVSEDSEQYTLRDVSGLLRLYMKAHTVAGPGPAGPVLSVSIESCTSALKITLISCVLLPGFSVLFYMCWKLMQRMKQRIWVKVPDPTQSSLYDWLYQTHIKESAGA